MNVLVGCERSGVVREAFRRRRHLVYSCDIEPPDDNSPYHITTDVLNVLDYGWDLAIFHPPCTHLCVSGSRWFPDKNPDQSRALNLVAKLWLAPIPYIAIENPVSIISTIFRKPDQTFQPWQFGHGELKRTCLWLKNLPPLESTNIVEGRVPRVHYMSGKDRSRLRSITYQGVAEAMADQWSNFCCG